MESKDGKEIQVAIQVEEKEEEGDHDEENSAKKVEQLPEKLAGEDAPPQEGLKTKSKRVAALDAFRGLTIVVII